MSSPYEEVIAFIMFSLVKQLEKKSQYIKVSASFFILFCLHHKFYQYEFVYTSGIWRFEFCVFVFFCGHAFQETNRYCSWTVATLFDFSTLFSTLVGPVNSAWDPQISLFSNFFIKNGFHGTIHTFKNYFATVFSVFSFSKINSIQTDP